METITKDELNKVTEKWLDETELKQNPLEMLNSRTDEEFDSEKEARKFAERLPDMG